MTTWKPVEKRKARVIIEFNDLDKAWRTEQALKALGVGNVKLEIPEGEE